MGKAVTVQLNNFLTRNEVAKHYDVPRASVIYATRKGYLKAVKIGSSLLYPKESLPIIWPVRTHEKRGEDHPDAGML